MEGRNVGRAERARVEGNGRKLDDFLRLRRRTMLLADRLKVENQIVFDFGRFVVGGRRGRCH